MALDLTSRVLPKPPPMDCLPLLYTFVCIQIYMYLQICIYLSMKIHEVAYVDDQFSLPDNDRSHTHVHTYSLSFESYDTRDMQHIYPYFQSIQFNGF